MAKGIVYLDGLDGVINDLNKISESLEVDVAAGIDIALTKIEDKMKVNAIAAFTDGYTQGVMVNSISHTVSAKNGFISGSVGVYDMSVKTGSASRKIPEPIIAYWYEFGIQPHSTSPGARAQQKGRRARKQTERIHPGSTPKRFLSNAFDALSDNILDDTISELNKRMEGKK